MRTQKWSVIAIVREPRAVLERFVAWYLHQGADRILLYFDDPNDPCLPQMQTCDPRVECQPCTQEFWESMNVAGRHFTKRQNAAMRHGYARIDEGWVAVVDADELIYPTQEGRVSDLLESLPPKTRSVIIKPVEYAWLPDKIDQTAFRRPMNARQVRRIYGAFSEHMEGNRGLVGHVIGKSITRAGIEITAAHPHWFFDADALRIVDDGRAYETGFALLHFYFLNFEDWLRKAAYRSKAQPRGRRTVLLDELTSLIEADDLPRLREIWENSHSLNPVQQVMMQKRGLLHTPDLDLGSITTSMFPPSRMARIRENLRSSNAA